MKRRKFLTHLIFTPLFLLYSTNSRAWFWVALRVVRALVSMMKLTKTVSRVNKQRALISGISMSPISATAQKVKSAEAKIKTRRALENERNITERDKEKLVSRIVEVASNIQDIKDLKEHIDERWNNSQQHSVMEHREHIRNCSKCKPVYDELTKNTTLGFSSDERNSDSESYMVMYEQAKYVISGDHHHEAFRLLKQSARIAIRQGESEYLLYRLQGRDANEVFWRLSHGHQGWDTIIRALKHNDATILDNHIH